MLRSATSALFLLSFGPGCASNETLRPRPNDAEDARVSRVVDALRHTSQFARVGALIEGGAVSQFVGVGGPLRAESRPTGGFSISTTYDPSIGLDVTTGLPTDVSMLDPATRPNASLWFGAELDVIHVRERGRFEELRVARTLAAARRETYRITLRSGVGDLRREGDRLVALDWHGRVRLATEPLRAEDARGVVRALGVDIERDGDAYRVVLSLDTDGLALPIVIDPAFVTVSAMSAPRTNPAVVTLKDGRVLVAGGGRPDGNPVTTVEIFDPTARVWKNTGEVPSLPTQQRFGTALVGLGDGRAAMIGGLGPTQQLDLLDPATLAWSSGPSPLAARVFHTATVLPDGKVFVFGGKGVTDAVSSSAEMFDPTGGTWTALPSAPRPRREHTATLLSDGSVLVLGGVGADKPPVSLAAVDRFAPSTSSWISVPPLPIPRQQHSVSKLADGRVLVIGGFDVASATYHSTSEIYDPATNKWSPGPSLPEPRFGQASLTFPSGRVLVVGGTGLQVGPLPNALLIDVATGAVRVVGKLQRTDFGAAPLSGERALFAGGTDGISAALIAEAAMFSQSAIGEACADGDECVSGICVAGKCANGCSASAECATGSYCEGGRCVAAKSNGATCGEPRQCATLQCVDAHCCAESRSCAPYVCSDTGCRTTCDTNDDCAAGNACEGSKCVPLGDGGVCSKDGLISTGKDGEPKSCTPYQCDGVSGSCLRLCASSSDCAPGFNCRSDTKECVSGAPAAATDDGGGCTFANARSSRGSPRSLSLSALAMLSALAVIGGGARRRARASRVR